MKIRKNLSPLKILWICHGKKHDLPKNRTILTLDVRKVVKPDILADLTLPLFEFIELPDIKKHINSFDEIQMKHCPRTIWTIDEFGEPGEHISAIQIADRNFFSNIYYLLKRKGLCIINNFELILDLTTRKSRFGTIDPIKQFMSSINDIFKVRDILDHSKYYKYTKIILVLEKK